MLSILTLLAQFGDTGFQPPAPEGNVYTDDVTKDPLSNLEILLSNVLGILTILAGIFFIVYFITAAFSMVTAGGDTGKLTKARDRMLHGVLGIIIVIASYAVIGLIGSIVGLDILDPASGLRLLIPTGAETTT